MQDFYPKETACVASSKRRFIAGKTTGNAGIIGLLSKFILILFIALLPLVSSATHIVGGALTYVHNGGNSYTITLVLYRDCNSTTAYPTNAATVIQVQQADGTEFSPSRDITTMVGGAITNVPYTLDSCAVAPNPIPCVEKRTYTATVNLL
ncbi:MAG: hypothetical protein H0W84_11400, partial [Bacteroidetes bacterium]|nr:hypothetical protein [Bacteroidota bacterium]